MDEPIAQLEQARSTVTDLAISYGPRVLTAVLVLFAGFLVGRWLGNTLDRLLQRLDLDITVRILLVRLTRAAGGAPRSAAHRPAPCCRCCGDRARLRPHDWVPGHRYRYDYHL